MTIDLVALITAQRDLQVKLGNHLDRMTQAERLDYIRENVLAATDELHEALAETGWKSWATSRHINRDAYLGELRDCWQFLTNLMLVAEPDPRKLAVWFADALAEKHDVNRRRIGAYDGITSKCPNCRRALDEVPIKEVMIEGTQVYFCGACNHELSSEMAAAFTSD